MRMTLRLQYLWLKLAIELASQIELQPLLTDLCPKITPQKILIVVKLADKRATRLVNN